MVRDLPVDAELVIMRAPIAGGDQGGRAKPDPD
jgi:hypothetical protein